MFSSANPLTTSLTSVFSLLSGGGPGQQPPWIAFHNSMMRWTSDEVVSAMFRS
jgi:hypothetical protein